MKTSKYLVLALIFAGSFAAPAFAQYTPPVYPYPDPVQMCPQLSYNLYRGLSDYNTVGQVTQLQQFLSMQGYYQPVTGYFGVITYSNVVRFQQQYAVYPVTGGVGPLTRAAIARVCGGTVYPPPPTYGGISITNVSGPNSLAVGVQGTWSITTNAPYGSYLSTSVRWGDEDIYPYPMASSAGYISQQNTFTHSYLQAGTYTITFTVTDNTGRSAQATASVVVGGGGCTSYWGCPPPSASPTITYLSPTQGAVGTTVTIYGSGFTQDNKVLFGNGGAVHVPSYNNGTMIYFTVPSAVGPCDWAGDTSQVRCLAVGQPVVPGAYQISVENQNGPSGSQTFTVTGTGGCISQWYGNCQYNVSAYPQTGYAPLTVTFTVSNYSGLYAVDFGDGTSASLRSGSISHTYYSRGTYTAQFSSDAQCLHTTPACMIAQQNIGSATVTVY